MLHLLTGFKSPRWYTVSDQYGETTRIALDKITFEIRAASPTARDRGNWIVYNMVNVFQANDIKHRDSGVRLVYPATKYFFSFDCAIADIQNYLYAIGFDEMRSLNSQYIYPLTFEPSSEKLTDTLRSLKHSGYFPYVRDGRFDPTDSSLPFPTFIRRPDKYLSNFIIEIEPDISIAQTTFWWKLSILQLAQSLVTSSLDENDQFPRYYSSLVIAREEADYWACIWSKKANQS